MKKLLYIALFVCFFSGSIVCGICHDCALWLAENKTGRVHAAFIKTKCYMKRFITRRRCCCRSCYKNNPNYRVKIISSLKDKYADGMVRCDRCGKHHICHVCGRRLCLQDCNDHKLLPKEEALLKV